MDYDKLLKNFDFKEIEDYLKIENNLNQEKISLLGYAFLNNKKFDLNLDNEKLFFLIKNSNLKKPIYYQFNNWRNCCTSPLMMALEFDKAHDLKLNNQMLTFMIENCNLLFNDEKNYNALMLALAHHDKLNSDNFDYLIKNCDVRNIADHGRGPAITYAIEYGSVEQLEQKLTSEHWDRMIEGINIKEIRQKKCEVAFLFTLGSCSNTNLINKILKKIASSYQLETIKELIGADDHQYQAFFKIIDSYLINQEITKQIKPSKNNKNIKI